MGFLRKTIYRRLEDPDTVLIKDEVPVYIMPVQTDPYFKCVCGQEFLLGGLVNTPGGILCCHVCGSIYRFKNKEDIL